MFFDRDGVVNELVPDPESGRPESPLSVEDIALIDGAAIALRRLQRSGFAIVGVSNQPAAAKGKTDRATLESVQARFLEMLAQEQVVPDGFQICFHHPCGTDPELGRVCECRKPAPGMLLAAAAELSIDLPRSWMVGDTDADVKAGRAAGCRTILVETAGSAHKRAGDTASDRIASSLADAVQLILDPRLV